jgi:hypothetical protein
MRDRILIQKNIYHQPDMAISRNIIVSSFSFGLIIMSFLFFEPLWNKFNYRVFSDILFLIGGLFLLFLSLFLFTFFPRIFQITTKRITFTDITCFSIFQWILKKYDVIEIKSINKIIIDEGNMFRIQKKNDPEIFMISYIQFNKKEIKKILQIFDSLKIKYVLNRYP